MAARPKSSLPSYWWSVTERDCEGYGHRVCQSKGYAGTNSIINLALHAFNKTKRCLGTMEVEFMIYGE